MHKRTKVNIAIFILLVGMACMFTAVVTDYWAVLSPRMDTVNQTCEAAHFGLWRLCKKQIYIDSEHFVEGKGCGPISLPGGESKVYIEEKHCLDSYCLSVSCWPAKRRIEVRLS